MEKFCGMRVHAIFSVCQTHRTTQWIRNDVDLLFLQLFCCDGCVVLYLDLR